MEQNLKKSILQILSSEQAYHYRIVPFEEKDDVLFIKTDHSQIASLQNELEIVFERRIKLTQVSKEELNTLLATNYRKAKNNSTNLDFSTDFLDKIILNAKNIGSSDIHFEPYNKRCRVRLRVDGKLLEQFNIPVEDYPSIVNKIKIKANLDIAEKRLPQDGRISIKRNAEDLDLRVSTLPTLHGEKIVLRILNKNTDGINLESLGLLPNEFAIYTESMKKPNGIILISGPTGSGKTTTLYATLKKLNKEETNILTIEDPIEYTLEGVNQVHLKESIGLDFETTLKTFLRQDPNVIMVGEIRDAKTAYMAIRASLTGRLVLSTIHTNSAWGTITRLIDMGIPPFLIASTLNLSVAQRLVRCLCTNCKKKSGMDLNLFPASMKSEVKFKDHFIPVGCPKCHFTGYSGRKAIYELLPVNHEVKNLIKLNEDANIIRYFQENNIATLKTNAINLIQSGETSIDEVYSILS
ncbi:GspE/PulE family protein [Croceivirga radicis]|uniref:GspE/PulE family protein n=1 Tax=Croceivirga radicis TaxID=1929488 RepID=UPI000255B31B|nr:GspE/PulE family protein [Croceivirga radicis]